MKSLTQRSRMPAVGAVLATVALVAALAVAPGSAAAKAKAKIHSGGVFTIGIATNPASLNANINDNISIEPIQRMYANSLFVLSGKNELVPSLALSYKLSNNGLTYTMNLRHGVKWQDGKPFTSKDVVFTLTKFLSLNPLVPSSLPKDVTSVKAVGKYKVVITLKEPFAPFMVGLAASTVYIEPQHVYGNSTVVKNNQANDHPIGTGPYMVKQWVPDQKVVLVRNPHYWGATKSKPIPYFKEVIADIITNPQTMVDDLLNGTIDYISTSFLPFTSITSVKSSSCCRIVLVHGTPSYDIMYTNTQRPPFNNVTVRRAIYMAITRKALIQDSLGGHGTLPLAPIPLTYAQLYTPKINLLKQYPYDPAKAAALLDKAGFPAKNGERFGKAITLLYSSGTGTFATETARIFKSQLAKITVNVNVVAEDLTSWATQTYVKKNFTLSFIGLTSENDPSLGIARAFACQPTPTAEFTNASGFCTKQVTTLFHQAVIAPTTPARQRAFAKVQKIIDSKLPSYELGWRSAYVAVSKKVKNWRVSLLSWGGSFNTTWSVAHF